jgi:hypothetical protein
VAGALGALESPTRKAAATLTISNIRGVDAGGYSVTFTNACGSSTSTAALVTINPCASSDYNGDGDSATDADIEAFFACMAGTCCPSCWYLGADIDADGDSATDPDIESFFRILAGHPC